MEDGQQGPQASSPRHKHARASCGTCLRLGRAAVGLLAEGDRSAITWERVVARARSAGPPFTLAGHVDSVDAALLLAYEALLERLLQVNRLSARHASSWEDAARRGMQVTMREIDAYPGAATLHYVEALEPGNDELRLRREAYLEQLVEEAHAARDDAPAALGLELLTAMIGTSLRSYAKCERARLEMRRALPAFDPVVHAFAPQDAVPVG